MKAGRGLRTALLLLFLVPGLAIPPAGAKDTPSTDGQVVVLLHGHSRSSQSMKKIEAALLDLGYAVENIDYPSREMNIDDLSSYLGDRLRECCLGGKKEVHFVTHSLGGILVRYYLEREPLDSVGRVVMLSPPNSGSELADLLNDIPVVNQHTSESRRELGTGEGSVPGGLRPAEYELGIIAGDRSLLPMFSWIIPGPDDGMVSVRSTKTEGMSDFLVVPHSHTFIMNSPEVIRQVILFLEDGAFSHQREAD
jgi:pimeloyl-ACP methyl ester carboxylesterase